MLAIEYVLIKSIIFVILYTVFHFAHHYLPWPIFSVSESVWEHLKIAFYSAILLASVEFLLLPLYHSAIAIESFFFSRLVGALAIVPLIFLSFYFVYGVFGIIQRKLIKVLSVVALTWAGGFSAIFIEAQSLHYPIENGKPLLIMLLLLFAMLLFLFIKFTYRIPVYPVFEEVVIDRKHKHKH